ncbi:recombinase family protein [Sphingomonas sp. M1-B02]|uniref:recombinase family protein n=1 Tax=Sphingomonas sp. M1-B02 TaxID=3114300 RepID=UPI0022409AFC|nr:recombinase family protein [Sphingomonas sp. S6-11]UZK66710.1 recombinase family protein [Sphingomonas sp. S6-11]
MKRLRCAIYTRKSTEEGLDMAFNSLDAQREACEAYVKSQKAEGWVLSPEAYDDGGFSGGTLERPGLVRLLADVRSGKVDVIVVYKVDRLTRALSDFARIVDVLDAAGSSFVSVTQAFNTTTSMGRLTLNVLLSFAQFEREVIAERVRDKVAQSKARGIWMGGNVPLGYDVCDRKLLPNPAEVATILHIFRSYLELPSVRSLKAALDEQGVRTKRQYGKAGPRGGGPFSRGALYWLLSNPIYLGKLRHKEKLHDGQHEAIVQLDLWEAVQAKLAASAAERRNATIGGSTALLTGMIRDSADRPMSPSFTVKQGRRYHYYVSSISKDIDRGLHGPSEPITRVPARALDAAVRASIHSLLLNEVKSNGLCEGGDTATVRKRLAAAAELALQVGPDSRSWARSLLERLDFSITVHAGRIDASVARDALLATLDHEAPAAPSDGPRIVVALDITWRNRGARLVITSKAQGQPSADPRLATLLAKAHQARGELFAEPTRRGDRHLERLARLAYLAPDITAAILDGNHPASLTSRRLLKLPGIPIAWSDQRKHLGLA